MIRLIVNADDFGFTRDVNDGIVEAHRHGILTATTLMANGAAFDHAVVLARENPSLDIGCHLVLVGGPGLPASVPELLWRIARGRIAIYPELKSQVEKILGAGVKPTHLDTHKHTHLAPPVLHAVVRLAREFNIPWVRRPFDIPMTGPVPFTLRTTATALRMVRSYGDHIIESAGCGTTDHFAGFQLTGRLRTAELLNLIRNLPDGLTEFMCHPGFCREELRAASTRLKVSREEELRALCAPEVRAALAERSIELTNYELTNYRPGP